MTVASMTADWITAVKQMSDELASVIFKRVLQTSRVARYRRGAGRKRVLHPFDEDAETNRAPLQQPGQGECGSGAKPSQRDPQQMFSLVSRFAKAAGWDHSIQMGKVRGQWPEIVGPDIARHCQIERISDGVLHVRTTSTAWATQLGFMIPQIQQRIDAEVGIGAIEEIRILGPAAPSWKRGTRVVKGRGPRDTYG